MTRTIRLTMAQALALFMSRQMTEIDGAVVPVFGGVWAIFGHGNVAGLGEALYRHRHDLPTWRAHNEQAMAHAAIAFAKAHFRRRFMAATSSTGPGSLNLVTAAGTAYVNRLPVLLLPGDMFASRIPDPVLQQAEDFNDGTVTVNDCLRPVSRYFDRIARPEQLVPAANRAMQVLTDPADCGPATLCIPQDVQTEAWDYPQSFFERRLWTQRRIRPDEGELKRAAEALKAAEKPVIVAGGGVLYSGASQALADFAGATGIPVCETQGGKSSLPDRHPLNMGAIGVTGTSASNRLAEEADLILAIGTRLQDFTTGSWTLFKNDGRKIVSLNVQPFDAAKHRALALVADAREGLTELAASAAGYKAPAAWTQGARQGKAEWAVAADAARAATNAPLPSDAQVIGALDRVFGPDVVLVQAAGGLPGELHKLWRAGEPGSYHMDYGFSTMGYEIAAGLGVKMARPDREVVVPVGDGSYMMLNSEIATSVMLGLKLTIVVLDNGGFGCINRLQAATGGAGFNNLFKDARHEVLPAIDFAAHAASMGAAARKVGSIAELETALAAAKAAERTAVVVIDTDPLAATEAGGHWWDVAVPEVSSRPEVDAARSAYDEKRKAQRVGD